MLVQWQLCLFYTTRVQQGIPVKSIKNLFWLLHKFSSSQFLKAFFTFSLIFIDFLVGFFFSKEHGKSNTMAFTGVVIEYPSMMRYISDWIFTDISFGVNLKVTLKVKNKIKIRLATVRCMINTCCFQSCANFHLLKLC